MQELYLGFLGPSRHKVFLYTRTKLEHCIFLTSTITNFGIGLKLRQTVPDGLHFSFQVVEHLFFPDQRTKDLAEIRKPPLQLNTARLL